jgi:hypothetical protein
MWSQIKPRAIMLALAAVLIVIEWGANSWVKLEGSGKNLAVKEPPSPLDAIDLQDRDLKPIDALDKVFGLAPRESDLADQTRLEQEAKAAQEREQSALQENDDAVDQVAFGKSKLRLFGISSKGQSRYAIFTLGIARDLSDTFELQLGGTLPIGDGKWQLTLLDVKVDSVTLSTENTETKAKDTIELVMFNYEK